MGCFDEPKKRYIEERIEDLERKVPRHTHPVNPTVFEKLDRLEAAIDRIDAKIGCIEAKIDIILRHITETAE